MQMAAGFWVSKTLASAVELGLFPALADHPADKNTLATALGLKPRPAEVLLTACTALGLLDKTGDLYRNSPMTQAYLLPDKPHYFGGVVRFCDEREYVAWDRLPQALRTNRPITWDPDSHESPFADLEPEMIDLIWRGMHSLSASTAAVLATTCDFSPYRRILDVGGGSGAYLIELCKRHAHLTGTVYDLPPACEIAKQNIASASLDKTIATASGDFQRDAELPGGHDLILLSMILHDWDEATGRMLLRKCRDALPPGGAVMISELLVNPERTGPLDAALMGMNMLAETTGGRNYAEDEYLAWLKDAGFDEPEIIRFEAAGANGVVIGRRPV
ncbi:methyltransferase [Streptomyces sp. NRRL B-1347]|uniref:methyltransferase n=1 Tax=Streptomyces sp. NRRL B-1347 TaxID=1476877 RepID=UPI0004C6AAF0|nr:methyltransferase [Streptomyces sp. NRRL B-1347]